ncbi:hypothetical protein BDZ89DRAFT_1064381 [Hymenopellis radicata]|nr:hypothetical protein BDZ89DRAFT_1064381 [Hymenopellis radicata]
MGQYRPSPLRRKARHRTPMQAQYASIRPSPAVHRNNRDRRSAPPDAYRHMRSKPDRFILQPLYEQSPSRNRRRTRQISGLHELEEALRPDDDDDDDVEDENDGDRSFFPWEDERTLVADLLHQDAEEDESDDEKLVQLVDSIQTSFSKYSKALLGDVADTLVPAVNHVKQAHHILNERVDRDYGIGILDFNEACVKMERLTISEYEEVHNAYEASKKRIADLREDLKNAYSRREQLWEDFEKKFDTILQPGLEILKELPAQMERAIIDVDKQSKKIHKNDTGSDKTIKDILTKLI